MRQTLPLQGLNEVDLMEAASKMLLVNLYIGFFGFYFDAGLRTVSKGYLEKTCCLFRERMDVDPLLILTWEKVPPLQHRLKRQDCLCWRGSLGTNSAASLLAPGFSKRLLNENGSAAGMEGRGLL
jgi:hypothetical protein